MPSTIAATCGVVLQARIGAAPRGRADLIPQVAGLDGLVDLAIRTPDEIPVLVILHGSEEVIGETHRVIGVLAGNGVVRFTVEVVAEGEAE